MALILAAVTSKQPVTAFVTPEGRWEECQRDFLIMHVTKEVFFSPFSMSPRDMPWEQTAAYPGLDVCLHRMSCSHPCEAEGRCAPGWAGGWGRGRHTAP